MYGAFSYRKMCTLWTDVTDKLETFRNSTQAGCPKREAGLFKKLFNGVTSWTIDLTKQKFNNETQSRL